ncbi:hypothetical protein IFM89_015082 [Coptis chinensis]|uniref:Uncharacterized protein n=1 Tax=Coptis chinensis TaxID=261450 RepID=A0A835IE27_9MAGN|nr:hypothetical protein IFM89_015082 [Coptis chinensis]
MSDEMLKGCRSKVLSVVTGGDLNCPVEVQVLINNAGLSLNNVVRNDKEDTLIWCPDIKGNFTTSSAFQEIRKRRNVCKCGIGSWVSSKFRGICNDRNEVMGKAAHQSSIVKQLWNAACIATMVILWKQQNKAVFEVSKASVQRSQMLISRQEPVCDYFVRHVGYREIIFCYVVRCNTEGPKPHCVSVLQKAFSRCDTELLYYSALPPKRLGLIAIVDTQFIYDRYVRLELLEGVVAYHNRRFDKCRKALTSAHSKYLQEARRALRMNNQNVDLAVKFLVMQKEKGEQTLKEDSLGKSKIMVHFKKPLDLEIRYKKDVAVEALQRSEIGPLRDVDVAVEALQRSEIGRLRDVDVL